ncbi:MAG: tetratricopeptide repeat protein [Dysgonomonas sp.]|nr:tetratricopeptide repeat protein [Dysgonomonas sp.]
MILQPIQDLQTEVHRLIMAGSRFAKNDTLLQKLVPELQKLGEKAPVIKKLTERVEKLIKKDEKKNAEDLLDINALINSILQVQNPTAQKTEDQEQLHPQFEIESLLPDSLLLRETITALSVKISDRIGILERALHMGAFRDFRTHQYVNTFLDKKFGDAIPLVMDKIIPSIGAPMIPYVLDSLQLADNVMDINRFKIIYNLDYSGMPELIEKVFSEKLPRHQAEALVMLADDEENRDCILSHLKNKNKLIRAGAYKALAKMNKKEDHQLLLDILLSEKDTANTEELVEVISGIDSMDIFPDIFDYIQKQYEVFTSSDSWKNNAELTNKLSKSLLLLKNKEDSRSFQLFLQLFQYISDESQDFSGMRGNVDSTVSIASSINACMATYNDVDSIYDFYTRAISSVQLAPPGSGYAVTNGIKQKLVESFFWTYTKKGTKENVYNTFIEYYKNRKISLSSLYSAFSNDVRPGRTLNGFFYSDPFDSLPKGQLLYPEKIDQRWIDLFYKEIEDYAKKEGDWSKESDKELLLIDVYESCPSQKFSSFLKENFTRFDDRVPVFLKLFLERNVEGWDLVIEEAMQAFGEKEYLQDIKSRLEYNLSIDKTLKSHAAKLRRLAGIINDKSYKDYFLELANRVENAGAEILDTPEKEEVYEYTMPENFPNIIKKSGVREIPVSYEWNDDIAAGFKHYDETAIQDRLLWEKLAKLDIHLAWALFASVSEWMAYRLSKFVHNVDTQQRLEAAWAGTDKAYIKSLHFKTWRDKQIPFDTQRIFLELLEDMYVDYREDKPEYVCKLYHLISLFRHTAPDTGDFNNWLEDLLMRINRDLDGKSQGKTVFRTYLFESVAFDEQKNREEFESYIRNINYKVNQYLHTPEQVYMMNVANGAQENKPYFQEGFSFSPGKFQYIEFAFGLRKNDDKINAYKMYRKAYEEDTDFVENQIYENYRIENKIKIEDLNYLLSINPKSGRANLNLGHIYYRDHIDLAIVEFSKAMAINPDLYRTEWRIKDLATKYTNLAYNFIQTKEFDKVVEHATIAIGLNPNEPAAYLNRGVGYSHLGEKEKMQQDYDKARALEPAKAAMVYANEAYELLLKKEWDKAIESANKALEIDPNNDGAYYNLACAYENKKEIDKALVAINRHIELDPEYSNAYINRAYYLRCKGRFEEALEDYERAYKLDSSNTLVHGNKGKTYAALNDFEKAKDSFQKSYEQKADKFHFLYLIYADFALNNLSGIKENFEKMDKMSDAGWDEHDALLSSFLRYAAGMDMKKNLAACEDLLQKDIRVPDYPLAQIVKVAIENGNTEKETLKNLAEKINKE